MSVYEEYSYLYYECDNSEYTPELHKTSITINNERYNGYAFKTKAGKEMFVYRHNSKYHNVGQQWGNPWSVWDTINNKNVITGRKTREHAIKDCLMMEV